MTSWDVYTCPKCKTEDCVPPIGKSKSPILIIGAFPGKDEIKQGRPFVGATGKVLKIELAYLGVSLNTLRICNLWIHEPNGNKDCFEYSMEQAIKEAKDKQAVLLIGSDTSKFFCGAGEMSLNGMKVTSQYLSAPLIMVCVQPATVFHGGVGELRLGLKRFSMEIKARKLL